MIKKILFPLSCFLLAGMISACGNQSPPTLLQVTDEVVKLPPSDTPVLLPEEDLAAEENPEESSTPDPISYPVVDTGQVSCFDDRLTIRCPEHDEIFYGQDAQYSGLQPAYQDNGDGTITDLNTGLIWIKDPGEKVDYYEGIGLAEGYELSGYDDWRVPTIKELYSLMDFSGIDDAVTGTDPFLDTDYFVFQYGDPSIGEREIDSQWITSTIYVDEVMHNQECFFGVNFADGRIKCYPTQSGRNNGYYLRLVRGEAYGQNELVDLGDGLITDQATGLVWQRDDSDAGMDWPSALDYCEALDLGGYDDWRLPNAKELQSIVDYSRSPGTTSSAAISLLFHSTPIYNESGQGDYPYYWSSTTHANQMGGSNAVYISFGRGMGYMNNTFLDVHGAGSQRSDPKTGDPADYPSSMGPQGDVRRLENYVRCVRGGVSDEIFTGGAADNSAFSQDQPPEIPSDQQNQEGGRPQIDLATAAVKLGVTEKALQDALGPPPPNLATAAATLGISEQALIAALGLPEGGPPQPK
jgi:hypothetical protein